MADTKISALTADTLTGTEEIPVADAGSSKKAAINDVRAFTLNNAGTGLNVGKVIRWIKRGETSVASLAQTAEQDLMTLTVPAGLLAADNDVLWFKMAFTCAANANTKRIRVYFGASQLIDSTAIAHNGARIILEGWVKRTGAATQHVHLWASETTEDPAWSTAITGGHAQASPTETLSGAVVLKATVTQGAASAADVTQDLMLVGYLPA